MISNKCVSGDSKTVFESSRTKRAPEQSETVRPFLNGGSHILIMSNIMSKIGRNDKKGDPLRYLSNNKINKLAEKGDLVGLKYIYDNDTVDEYDKSLLYTNVLFGIACDNKHYHIMRYLVTKYKFSNKLRGYTESSNLSIGDVLGCNLFNHYCRERQIDIIIEIIKITIKIKQPIDFEINELIIINNRNNWVHIIDQLSTSKNTHNKIISYVESCGVGLIHEKLII